MTPRSTAASRSAAHGAAPSAARAGPGPLATAAWRHQPRERHRAGDAYLTFERRAGSWATASRDSANAATSRPKSRSAMSK